MKRSAVPLRPDDPRYHQSQVNSSSAGVDPHEVNRDMMAGITDGAREWKGKVSDKIIRGAMIEIAEKNKVPEGSVFVVPGMERKGEEPQQQDHAMAFAREHAAKHALPQPGESTLPSSGPRWIRGANSLTPKLNKMSAGICAEQRPNYRIEHPCFPGMLPRD